ncbi:MAG: hypothetical protein KGZ65_04045 [Sphingomonadales bacterium]|nr:hypothetical protein [Sphingomonadaceae bacterium]MBS3930384.1 hypothetical protein [Sphingomonadales bacterium]
MKRLVLVAVVASVAACSSAPVKAPLAVGCGPTQYTRQINAASSAVINMCFLADGSVKWTDGEAVPVAPQIKPKKTATATNKK